MLVLWRIGGIFMKLYEMIVEFRNENLGFNAVSSMYEAIKKYSAKDRMADVDVFITDINAANNLVTCRFCNLMDADILAVAEFIPDATTVRIREQN
jgi:hypothetical protein